jgi:hypothetical protein
MNADRIARSYRWLEYAAFGFELERARFDFLEHAAGARRVLVLGEAMGDFSLVCWNRIAARASRLSKDC